MSIRDCVGGGIDNDGGGGGVLHRSGGVHRCHVNSSSGSENGSGYRGRDRSLHSHHRGVEIAIAMTAAGAGVPGTLGMVSSDFGSCACGVASGTHTSTSSRKCHNIIMSSTQKLLIMAITIVRRHVSQAEVEVQKLF